MRWCWKRMGYDREMSSSSEERRSRKNMRRFEGRRSRWSWVRESDGVE